MESTHVERKGEDLAKIPRGRAGSGMDAKSKVTLVVWGHHMFSFLYQPLGVVPPIPEATALGLHVILSDCDSRYFIPASSLTMVIEGSVIYADVTRLGPSQ